MSYVLDVLAALGAPLLIALSTYSHLNIPLLIVGGLVWLFAVSRVVYARNY